MCKANILRASALDKANEHTKNGLATAIRRTALLLPILFLAACAVSPEKVRTAVAGRSLGLSVCLEDQLQNAWIGTTVFNNDFAEQPVPEWRLADTAEQKIVGILQNSKLFSDVKILPRCTDPKRASPETLAVDLVLYVETGSVPDQVGGTNQHQAGIGLFQRSVFGVQPFAVLHSVLSARLTDLASKKSVGSTDCSAQQQSTSIIDDSMLLTPAQLKDTQAPITDLVRQSASDCMLQLGLAG